MSDDPAPSPTEPRRRGRCRRVCAVVGAAGVALITVLVIWPTPGALIVRAVFEYGGKKTGESLAKHRVAGIDVTTESYRPDDDDATVDIYRSAQAGPDDVQPVVVWTHGGGWVAGTPQEAGPYFTQFAAQGFTVVSVKYGLAPGKKYPLPLHQLNDALGYLVANRERLGIDTDRIVMAGDSAGSQITSQVATAITSPEYARELGLDPELTPEQLRGVILHCGIYDAGRFLSSNNPVIAWAIKSIIRAYTGSGDPDSSVLQQFSSYDHVTKDFPTAFVAGGNDDPLTDSQSKPLVERLRGLGVDVETAFFPKDYRPKLPHEFQFDLDTEAGQDVLGRTIAFAKQRTAKGGSEPDGPRSQ
ncbi:MAG: alpha/beta hydrolase [Patulibacter sp.]|nr:alpha/beta hydrolase [Patulibacter sp.]